MITIRYLQTKDSSPKELYCLIVDLLDTLLMIEPRICEYKVYLPGMTLDASAFGHVNATFPKWVSKFHYED